MDQNRAPSRGAVIGADIRSQKRGKLFLQPVTAKFESPLGWLEERSTPAPFTTLIEQFSRRRQGIQAHLDSARRTARVEKDPLCRLETVSCDLEATEVLPLGGEPCRRCGRRGLSEIPPDLF